MNSTQYAHLNMEILQVVEEELRTRQNTNAEERLRSAVVISTILS